MLATWAEGCRVNTRLREYTSLTVCSNERYRAQSFNQLFFCVADHITLFTFARCTPSTTYRRSPSLAEGGSTGRRGADPYQKSFLHPLTERYDCLPRWGKGDRDSGG